MKKILKKIFGSISFFILGAHSKIFAIEQTDVYGPPPSPKGKSSILDINQSAVYGPAPDPSFSSLTSGQIFSIVASVLLFIIGLIVILNKKIKKNTKVLTVAILSITITALLL